MISDPQRHELRKQPSNKRLSIYCCSMKACFVGACILLLTWRSTVSISDSLVYLNNWLWSLPLNKITCSTTVRGSSPCNLNELTNDIKNETIILPSLASVQTSDDESLQQTLSAPSDEQTSFSQVIELINNSNQTNTSNYYDFEPHVFEPWPTGTALPCFKPEVNWSQWDTQNEATTEGIFYLKPYKTGSSSSSGITLRIARNVAKRMGNGYATCKTRFGHGPNHYPGKALFRNRTISRSFLWTAVRDPTRRAVSAFFHFGVGRRKMNTTDESFISFLDTVLPFEDYYFGALHSRGKFNRNAHDAADTADEIFSQYNFIGITERLDESAVVLMMLLDLKISDILYLAAKTNGGYDDGGGGVGCTLIPTSIVSPGMKEYFQSDVWRQKIQYDLTFYIAVNKSLDLTIDYLGREEFEDNFAKYKRAQAEASKRCLPTTIFPCDESGFHGPNVTDCLWSDSGCGTTCLDEVARDLHLD